MSAAVPESIVRRMAGDNLWLGGISARLAIQRPSRSLAYEILPSEQAVGQAQFAELVQIAQGKSGDIVMILLGGRGAQALHRLLGELAQTGEIDALLSRLHLFTQDALAPLRVHSGLSFVRDFERLLGPAFLRKVKSFTPMQTDTEDLASGLISYLRKLDSFGAIDICFLGLGPEAEAASHLAYIRPGSGAEETDLAGMIPISSSILEHHISKFKVGGSEVSPQDEAECRAATHILTLGPATILKAKRIVQSVVDASTAPGKRESYRRLLDEEISDDPGERARQMDANPGLWLRLHDNVRSLILSDVLS